MYTKNALRAAYRAKRKNIENKAKKSSEIVERALALPQVLAADSWFIFYPLKDEVDLLPLLRVAKERGKKIAFPLCDDKDGNMSFREVCSLDGLTDGYFGLREPSTDAPEALPQNSVIFLPALAIDKQGYRLGYGKGYYDRYLAKHADLKPFTVGVIYKELLFDELPHDKFDIPCDAVICDC